ncbi:MAG: hypothetical protein IPK59_04410 [Rhodospirillaceae bacterium]|nr:hypothetical protein [Rhodospirillaceae bacterium]
MDMGAGNDWDPAKPARARPDPAASAKPVQDDKARRQAEALRANLKRRKTQQRVRADPAKSPTGQD